jgi:hypothetical protein
MQIQIYQIRNDEQKKVGIIIEIQIQNGEILDKKYKEYLVNIVKDHS